MRKEKYEELIMAVKRQDLFKENDFQGFKKADEVDFQSRILENFEYVKRGEAEKDESLKQPIGYSILVDDQGRIFAYQRAKKDDDYTEKRLQGKWSWGVGGHIDKVDEDGDNPIKTSMARELEEEVKIDGDVKEIEVMGYINDDSDSVGRVHFGILYLVKVDGKVSAKDTEITNGKMRSIEELKEIVNDSKTTVEEWSKIALKFLENNL
ncbi:MAG: NUDIX domain-containing protein [Patescibacteria group bacterium]